MTATIELDVPREVVVLEPAEQRLVLYGIEWDQYEQISDALSGRHVRLTYDAGTLEFMTISPKHSWISRILCQFVVILTEATGMTRRSCGDMTLKSAEQSRGIEPDECFYLIHEPAIRGRDEIDFSIDPPPDLGVEVDITATSRRRMPVYAALRVPEIWRYSRDRVAIHRLTDDGTYAVAAHSEFFPFVTSETLTTFLARRTELDENALVQAFREWARTTAGASKP